jgi:hypothetical protein
MSIRGVHSLSMPSEKVPRLKVPFLIGYCGTVPWLKVPSGEAPPGKVHWKVFMRIVPIGKVPRRKVPSEIVIFGRAP